MGLILSAALNSSFLLLNRPIDQHFAALLPARFLALGVAPFMQFMKQKDSFMLFF